MGLEPRLRNKRSHCNEKPAHCNEDPTQPKINKLKNKTKPKKQISNKDLLYITGNYMQYLVITYNGKDLKKKIYRYIEIGITLLYT